MIAKSFLPIGRAAVAVRILATAAIAALAIACSPTEPPQANDYATPDRFRAALYDYHDQNAEGFWGECINVQRYLTMAIYESSDMFPPDGRGAWPNVPITEWVRNRHLVNLKAADDGWAGVNVDYLKAFENACDEHKPVPGGPGAAG